ncbi:MAG: hypothetical protein C0404_08180 [Verrucomicrobia bacterium]|nr:hypothetical protein [Verrucomicrobiota bacterium]
MKYPVSDAAQKATTKCTKGFSCLTGQSDVCEVEACINESVYFVYCLDKGNCSYKKAYGHGHFCTCPTRQELFNKHKR